ncbi:site-specific integrase [Winogradskyella sediminis]|uniref:Site-specific recombinase XerD n=1 Tax=Winogradskyella sediminis TaxID=1382466 RepID=A0A1H1SM62_9FLAO|nr:site-specific integrase [Winogradskyella sediminis]SDS48806.1 Site-specific recombinase XerD [Winogradskyella sediminis]
MKVNILYLIHKSKVNAKGRCPIRCRITYSKKRTEFSTGQFVNPDNWNNKQQLVKSIDPEAEFINTQLSLIKTKINKAFLLLQMKESDFITDDIYKLFKGEKLHEEQSVVEFFKSYLNKLKTLVGIDIKQLTWNKFFYIKNDIAEFIKWKYNTSDYPLKKLNLQFVIELEFYYKTVKHLKQITINKKIQRFKKVIRVAVAENYLDKNPFMLHKPKTVRKEVVFLSTEELCILEKHVFTQKRLQFVKNLFIFSCYTGLPYRELMNLKHDNIIEGFDGNLWIKMTREKTSKSLSIPLMPKAVDVMELFNEEIFVFPRLSNQRYNSYLKEVADILGIDKNLTTHMARRTFASTVLLYNDVPMEVVSELLGHSSMKVTQESYGKVVQEKVSQEIIKLKSKMD